MITGRVFDEATGAAIAKALVEYEQIATSSTGHAVSARNGDYYIPLLPPGTYRVRVSYPEHQAREIYNLNLPVAGYVRVDFALRPLEDVWERHLYGTALFSNNTVLPFFGPDFDPAYVGVFAPERSSLGQLEPSISEVIDPKTIESMPLVGRDIYTSLVLEAGVAADSATRRSLGLSVNGQRPWSSNFLLDGLENNDQLLSGPAVQLAPEMVQEYRISTNNFSAEYGGTSGYVANAITRGSAARAWHTVAYSDLNNSVLNSNTFQNNWQGMPRNPLHQIEAGFSVGGAMPRTKLYALTALDFLGSRSFSDPISYVLPTQAWAAKTQGSRAQTVLLGHPPSVWANSNSGMAGRVNLTKPVTLRRITGLERLDYALFARSHLSGRISANEFNRPDFNWSPYGEAPLTIHNLGFAVDFGTAWRPSLVTEVRGGVQGLRRSWDLALGYLPGIAGITTQTGGSSARTSVNLPGFCCQVNGIAQGWQDKSRSSEISGTAAWSHGSHLLKAGGGELHADLHSAFRIPAVDHFSFTTLQSFAADQPYAFVSILSRVALLSGHYQAPDATRSFAYDQPYAFLQEDWRLSRRFTITGGIRYERFSAPADTGNAPHVVVTPEPNLSFANANAATYLSLQHGKLFATNPNRIALRVGFSVALLSRLGTVLRGGYGTFYDRAPDNIWITAAANDFAATTFGNSGSACSTAVLSGFYKSGSYSVPPSECGGTPGSLTLFGLTSFQPGLHAPLIQSGMLSLQQPLGRNLAFELNGLVSKGQGLVTTDVLNRPLPRQSTPENLLPKVDYRTNQGVSDYAAFSTTVRYRSGPATFHLVYTWSHSIDNQSDPLLGGYFDLGFSNQTNRTQPTIYGSFSFPSDVQSDRGNSDFDQRQSMVGWAYVSLPSPPARLWKAILGNWSAAAVFTARSGLPYSVFVAGGLSCSNICNERANLISRDRANIHVPATGGVTLLNASAFSIPATGHQGDTGRNAFRGPGFGEVDVSLSRTVALRALGEGAQLVIRADAFNFLNHANLESPQTLLGASVIENRQFGFAAYGGLPGGNSLPSVTPLIDSSRQVHLLLRFVF